MLALALRCVCHKSRRARLFSAEDPNSESSRFGQAMRGTIKVAQLLSVVGIGVSKDAIGCRHPRTSEAQNDHTAE